MVEHWLSLLEDEIDQESSENEVRIKENQSFIFLDLSNPYLFFFVMQP